MSWNIAPECVSTVTLSIIWIYSRKGNPIPSLKNRLFQACFLVTFCAMTSNILSTLLIYRLNEALLVPAWIVTIFYFLTTPLMGMTYFYYVFSNLYENQRWPRRITVIFGIPGVLYVISVFLNFLTKDIFSISLEEGYAQGPYIVVTYVVFYFYCLACMGFVWVYRSKVPEITRIILFAFPLMAALVIVVQLLFPYLILSGTAATSALLIVYLYLQNKQISIDYLTSVPNRHQLLKMLELKLRKNAGAEFTVIVVSMKEFKVINDTYGQNNGDLFLVAVSDYLKSKRMEKNSALYRYSGDEFAILAETKDQEKIEGIVNIILARMSQPWDVRDCSCMLSAAIGVVSYPTCRESVAGLINGIEYSISIAKNKAGRSNVCYCDPELLKAARRHQKIQEILKECVKLDSFEMYYQPILNVNSGKFYLSEALMRINESSIGRLLPGEFIPVAEESGLIVELTYRIFEKVCSCVRHLLDEDIVFDGVNVNFSSLQFTQKDLIPRIVEIMERWGIPFSKIKIEITESTLAENQEIVMDFANRMHDLGVGIGLDDFGTGFSNLSSVIELHINTVKLDRSLIWSAMEKDRPRIVVENLTKAFTELGMTVLAEGVETEHQSQFVVECGCSLIQGFLYAKPMPEREFLELMRSQQASA